MYPVLVAFRKTANAPVTNGGLVFLSEDLKHDFHQVEEMEWMVVDFLVEKFG